MPRLQALLAAVLTALLSCSASAQSTAARPERGSGGVGSAFSVSDIESVSLTSGNVNLSIPLASLPPIAGGKLGLTLSAVYNSKLWDVMRSERRIPGFGYQTYVVNNPQLSAQGGWRISSGGYTVVFRDAEEDYDYVPPSAQNETTPDDWVAMQHRWKKAVLITPDGAEHELRPVDSINRYTGGTVVRDYLLNYYRDTPDTINAPMRYYTFDGTYLQAVINPSNSSTLWTVYQKDGTQVVQTSDGVQRIMDTNGNSIKIFSDNQGVTHYQDEGTGRALKLSSPSANVWRVSYQTVGGDWQNIDLTFGTTRVQGKLYTVNDWDANAVNETGGEGAPCLRDVLLTPRDVPVLREIAFPATEPGASGKRFTFAYNSDETEQVSFQVREVCGTDAQTQTVNASRGMGALSRITTPSGAEVSYTYNLSATHNFGENADEMTEETITSKKVRHDNLSVTDEWTYNIDPRQGTGSVTSPDGTQNAEVSFPQDPRWGAYSAQGVSKSGLVYRSSHSGKVMVERHWEVMPFAGANTSRTSIVSSFPVNFNPVVTAEYTSLLEPGVNGTNVPVRMAAKTFQYDYNGNLLQTTEYDWFDPALVTRDGAGVPTGVPAGATVLRTTVNSYHREAASASSANVYAKRLTSTTTPVILNAVKETTTGASITQFRYDGLSYGTAPTQGNVTHVMSFDDQGDLNTANDRWATTESAYDSYGNVSTTTDANGNVTQLFYEDATHAMPTRVVVDPLNGTGAQTSLTTYDYSTGLVTSTTDANNQTTDISYVNQLTNSIDPLNRPGLVTQPAADVDGSLQRREVRTIYEDEARRVRVESDLRAQGDRLLKSRETRDELGRVVLSETSEDGVGYSVFVRKVYEQAGRIVYTSNPMRATPASTDGWTRTTRDEAGRVVSVATFSGDAQPQAEGCTAQSNCTGVSETVYYAEYTTVTDQTGKARRSKTDALGRLARLDEPAGANASLGGLDTPTQPTGYFYDMLGNLTTVRQGAQLQNGQYTGGQTRTFVYGSLSRLSSAANPESGITTYEYDAKGNLKKKTDARGISTNYTYDGLGRLTLKNYSDPTPDVAYTYDTATANGKGRVASVSSSVSTYSYLSYDSAGQVLASSQTTGEFTYQMPNYRYDLAGNLTSEQYPSGRVVKTEYDAAGRIAGVKNDATGLYYAGGSASNERIRYTAHGAASSVKLGNGLWEHTHFNSRLQPTQIGLGASVADSGVLKLVYSYGASNNNGNILSQTITIPSGATLTQTYTYDALNRLESATEMNGQAETWKQKFSYDVYGNRAVDANETTPAIVGPNPGINPANNRISAAGYVYDLAGNLISTPGINNSLNYEYDAENLQTAYKYGQSTEATYEYAGDGKRVKKTVNGSSGAVTTIYVYNAHGQLVAEYSNQTGGEGVSYVTQDHLGSARVVSGSSGEVKSRHDFLPFGGELLTDVAPASARSEAQSYRARDKDGKVRQKFAGYERDGETELDYAQARYYSPAQGRFTSVDPLPASMRFGNPQTLNRYVYALNNPLRFYDPDGEETKERIRRAQYEFTMDERNSDGELIHQVRVSVTEIRYEIIDDNGNVVAESHEPEAIVDAVNTGKGARSVPNSALNDMKDVVKDIVEVSMIRQVSSQDMLAFAVVESRLGIGSADPVNSNKPQKHPYNNPMQLSGSSNDPPTTNRRGNIHGAISVYLYASRNGTRGIEESARVYRDGNRRVYTPDVMNYGREVRRISEHIRSQTLKLTFIERPHQVFRN